MASMKRNSTVLECLPFVVDSWANSGREQGRNSSEDRKPYFLTHCHKDHTDGIADCAVDIFCTDLTRRLLLVRQPDAGRANRFHTLHVGRRLELSYGPIRYSVTALDANHCPGSVMLLFQGCFGNILHTGDCRLNQELVRSVKEALASDGSGCGLGQDDDCRASQECGAEALDLVYLDCTFADLPLDFPSREDAVRHAERLIRGSWQSDKGNTAGQGPDGSCSGGAQPAAPLRRVMLSADLLGTEAFVAMAGSAFGQPVYVPPPERHREYGFANADLVRQRRQELELLLPPHVLRMSDDPACLFHLCGVRDFAQRGLRPPRARPGAARPGSWQAGEKLGSSTAGSLAVGGGTSSSSVELEGSAPQLGAASESAVELGEVLPRAAGVGSGHGGGEGTGCLYVRASTQVFGKQIRDEYTRRGKLLSVRKAAPAPTSAIQERAVHYVLFSVHSSRSELVAAMAALRPRAVRPISADQLGCIADVVLQHAGPEGAEAVEQEIQRRMAWAWADAQNEAGGVGVEVLSPAGSDGAARCEARMEVGAATPRRLDQAMSAATCGAATVATEAAEVPQQAGGWEEWRLRNQGAGAAEARAAAAIGKGHPGGDACPQTGARLAGCDSVGAAAAASRVLTHGASCGATGASYREENERAACYQQDVALKPSKDRSPCGRRMYAAGGSPTRPQAGGTYATARGTEQNSGSSCSSRWAQVRRALLGDELARAAAALRQAAAGCGATAAAGADVGALDRLSQLRGLGSLPRVATMAGIAGAPAAPSATGAGARMRQHALLPCLPQGEAAALALLPPPRVATLSGINLGAACSATSTGRGPTRPSQGKAAQRPLGVRELEPVRADAPPVAQQVPGATSPEGTAADVPKAHAAEGAAAEERTVTTAATTAARVLIQSGVGASPHAGCGASVTSVEHRREGKEGGCKRPAASPKEQRSVRARTCASPAPQPVCVLDPAGRPPAQDGFPGSGGELEHGEVAATEAAGAAQCGEAQQAARQPSGLLDGAAPSFVVQCSGEAVEQVAAGKGGSSHGHPCQAPGASALARAALEPAGSSAAAHEASAVHGAPAKAARGGGILMSLLNSMLSTELSRAGARLGGAAPWTAMSGAGPGGYGCEAGCGGCVTGVGVRCARGGNSGWHAPCQM